MPVVPVPPSAASFAGTHSTCSANTTKSEVKLPRQMHTSATSPRAPPRIFRCRFVLYAPAACARALLLGALFAPLPRPPHAPLPPLRRHTPPAKLRSHDATPHCTRTACALCSHCLVCCRRAMCALVGSGISLSAPLLAGLDSLASSAAVLHLERRTLRLGRSHGIAALSANIRKIYIK